MWSVHSLLLFDFGEKSQFVVLHILLGFCYLDKTYFLSSGKFLSCLAGLQIDTFNYWGEEKSVLQIWRSLRRRLFSNSPWNSIGS